MKPSLHRERADYDYVSGRLRARFRDFIPVPVLFDLAASSLDNIGQFLADSAYGELYRSEFMILPLPLAVRLELLVCAETEARTHDLKAWSSGELRLYMAVLTLSSDIENGQLFLRSLQSRRQGTSPLLVGNGELNGDFLRHLWSCKGDRGEIADACRYDPTEISNILLEAVMELDKSGSIWDAEWLFMNRVFSWVRNLISDTGGASSRTVKKFLAYLTDLWNFRIWLGAHLQSRHGADTVRYLSGGTVSKEKLFSTDKFRILLRGTFWQPPADSERTLLDLEQQFVRYCVLSRRENPLGVEVEISYMGRLFCEWRSLMAILRGVQSGLEPSAIRSVLPVRMGAF